MNIINKSIFPRIVVPVGCIFNAGRSLALTCAGVIATPFAIARPSNLQAQRWAKKTEYSQKILPYLCLAPLLFLNPIAKKDSRKSHLPNGIFTTYVSSKSNDVKKRILCSRSSSFAKGLGLRAVIAGEILAKTVTRVMDLALGILGLVTAIATFGTLPKVNTFAVRNLAVFGVIDDWCRGLRELAHRACSSDSFKTK